MSDCRVLRLERGQREKEHTHYGRGVAVRRGEAHDHTTQPCARRGVAEMWANVWPEIAVKTATPCVPS